MAATATAAKWGRLFWGRLTSKSNPQLTSLIHDGIPKGGMPPNPAPEPEMSDLVKYLRTIQRRFDRPVVRMTAELVNGTKLEGQVLGEGFEDVQLSTADKKVHLLRRVGAKFREVTTDIDWPTYNGDPRGNRYTTMAQITRSNVGRLAAKWVFTVPNAGQLQMTPVVVGGIMYITAPNECYALDAGTGRQIWRYRVPPTPDKPNDSGPNRGVAVAGDRLFLETVPAHLIALNRFTANCCGIRLWRTGIRTISPLRRR